MMKVDYPKKSGKIYVESYNNESPCNIAPRVKALLEKHNWKITNNSNEADYELFTATTLCKDDSDKILRNALKDITKPTKNSDYIKNNKEFDPNATNAIVTGANTSQYNSSTGGAMMLIGLLMGMGGNTHAVHRKAVKKPVSPFAYANRITIHNRITDETVFNYISSKKHSPAKTEEIDDFLDDLFY